MRSAIQIDLSAAESAALRQLLRRASPRIRRRANIILLAERGWTNRRIAEELATDVHTIARWRNRYATGGVAAIQSESVRTGRPSVVRDAVESEIINLTRRLRRRGKPCSLRLVAKQLGVNHMLVARVWRLHGLQ